MLSIADWRHVVFADILPRLLTVSRLVPSPTIVERLFRAAVSEAAAAADDDDDAAALLLPSSFS